MGGPGSGRRAEPGKRRVKVAPRFAAETMAYLSRIDLWQHYLDAVVEQRRETLREALRVLEDMPGQDILRDAGRAVTEPLTRESALDVVRRELLAGNTHLETLLKKQ
jgi:hypothetical protein